MSGTKSGFYSTPYNKAFYKVGDKLNDGTTVTASNIGNLNNQIAMNNSKWTNAYDLTGSAVKDPTPPSGGGGGGTATPTGSGFSMYDYLNNLYSSYASNKQAQLEAAYARARDNINAGYESSLAKLMDSLNATKSAINSSYDNSLKNVNTDANKSLREAYINNEISQKNLGQQMSALGLSGGATESTIAKMNNQYGNASNDIRTTLNTNIGNLNANRDQSLADAIANYNSNAASLEQQKASQLANIEQALASGLADALDQQFSFQTSSGYLSALQDAIKNASSYTATPTQATNAVQTVSTQQLSPQDMASATNNQAYLEYLARLLEQYKMA